MKKYNVDSRIGVRTLLTSLFVVVLVLFATKAGPLVAQGQQPRTESDQMIERWILQEIIDLGPDDGQLVFARAGCIIDADSTISEPRADQEAWAVRAAKLLAKCRSGSDQFICRAARSLERDYGIRSDLYGTYCDRLKP